LIETWKNQDVSIVNCGAIKITGINPITEWGEYMFVIDITADNKVIETIRPEKRPPQAMQQIAFDRLEKLKAEYGNSLKALRRYEFQ
jgi:hypothetical protein